MEDTTEEKRVNSRLQERESWMTALFWN